MKLKKSSIFRKVVVFVAVAILLINAVPTGSIVQADTAATSDTACRFGINAPLSPAGFDITSLKIASLLDWGAVNNPSLPYGVEYIRVLRLRNDVYAQTLFSLPAWVQANPGSVWIVGNEPDTTYENQDALLPETYADRYYALAKIIRQLDKTAQIGFGPIVQPTPIRIRYLQAAWNRLKADAGGSAAASALIDIWSPHSFILNEEVGSWGTGIPPGFEADHEDAVIITNYTDTYSITIFQDRIIGFRLWMASIGERNKPLWITEYGSLFPPVDPIGGSDYVNVSDVDTATYMWNTFDFLNLASDRQSGMPADNYQLVQRWFWYSLNDHRYHFGGSIYNPDYPDYGPIITLVGVNFRLYQSMYIAPPDLLPLSLSITPVSFNQDHTLVNYRLQVTIDNNEFYDATCGQLWIYDGNPEVDGQLIAGPLPASAFRANSGTALVTAYWMNAEPLIDHTLYVEVEPIGVADTNPGNNIAQFTVFADVPKLSFLPVISR